MADDALEAVGLLRSSLRGRIEIASHICKVDQEIESNVQTTTRQLSEEEGVQGNGRLARRLDR
jgi:hypothetical protein